eukprot:2285509-Amphidinium_carterae.1
MTANMLSLSRRPHHHAVGYPMPCNCASQSCNFAGSHESQLSGCSTRSWKVAIWHFLVKDNFQMGQPS